MSLLGKLNPKLVPLLKNIDTVVSDVYVTRYITSTHWSL